MPNLVKPLASLIVFLLLWRAPSVRAQVKHPATPSSTATPVSSATRVSHTVTVGSATPSSATPSSATPSNAAPSGSPSAVESNLSKLPGNVPLQPPPPGFDTEARSTEILNHLNAIVRYFRTHLTPIQKVGEPSDALYRDQALTQVTEIAALAFQSAKAEAALLSAYSKRSGAQTAAPAEGEAQKLQGYRATVAQQLTNLQAQDAALTAQLAKARPRDRGALEDQRQEVQGAIELNKAMGDALNKTISLSDTQGNTGLAADIERLQRSAPELTTNATKPLASAPITNLSVARSSGVASQAVVLFQLLNTRHAIDQWLQDNGELHTQALALRTPLTNIVRGLIQSSASLSQQAQTALTPNSPTTTPAAAPSPPHSPASASVSPDSVRRRFDSVTATFNVVSAATVPLSQEIITLEQSRANLLAWRMAVATEYNEVLRDLLIRLAVIAFALAGLFLLGEVWRRATTRYVHDSRRRRQLLIMRRFVITFLSGLVLIFGFVTQFNSLATFAGFITAGLAVGLQTILLSVAAYFFIIGRYGVRVGDRISVSTVTGDVIDVGLVRFYVMELAGSGTELHPTGRVAVLSNAILFQAGTPLYKQMPGTEYAWHELTVKLTPNADYKAVSDRLLSTVTEIYNSYKAGIQSQYRQLQAWMDTPIAEPAIESHLQLVEGGLQLWVRYPVELRDAAATDDRITQAMLHLMATDQQIKDSVTSPPAISAVVKG